MKQGHEATADAGTLLFHHGQRGGHRDGRVERVAALGEYFESGVGGQEVGAGDGGLTGAP